MKDNQEKLKQKQQALAELRFQKEKEEAALKIQKHYRGYQGRKRYKAMIEEKTQRISKSKETTKNSLKSHESESG